MKDILFVILSVILLVFGFILQKAYQKRVSSATDGSLNFSIISAFFSIVFLVLINQFSISFTWFSVIMACLHSVCCLGYTIIGFRIMKESTVSLYMLFLMCGGMIVPSIWGWIFLDETPTVMHILGIIMILIAIVLNNFSTEKLNTKVLLMCCAVFFLNGFVSVFSKLHQINTVYKMVSTHNFALISKFASLVMCLMLKGTLLLKKGTCDATTKAHNSNLKFIDRILPILIILLYCALTSISSILQLESAKNLPASILYPIITGGTIALTDIFAFIFFKEKLSVRGWLAVALCCLGTCFFIG